MRLFSSQAKAQLDAIGRSQAIIEFKPDGTIITANDNFLKVMGYKLEEIRGKHHSIFVDPKEQGTQAYRDFWTSLGRGEFQAAEYKRLGKGGKEVWIQASYNPVFGRNGKPVRVVKVATDVTEQKMGNANAAGQIDAINKAQAVIHFDLDGTILQANENFLATMGYRLEEIRGRHHSIFVDKEYGQSREYQKFWEDLRAGRFIAEEFMRIGRGGKKVWIQASYNPIFDMNGKVVRIVKFATDVTGRVEAVQGLGDALDRLAKGDLVTEIANPFIPALDSLRLDLNKSLTILRKALQTVGCTAASIDSGASEISKAAQEFSQRTEQQSASVEETAAVLEQLTTAVRHSAQKAEEAGVLVAKTRSGAEASGAVVQQTITAMGEIEKSSREISSILGVIDEIAFQTNLLALNAGVEAARAGEAGRGFAVVAQEVRELAQRSAKAAKEIKGLITRSGEQVASGVNLVSETGSALTKIAGEIQEINDHVVAIVEASREQSLGLLEISSAVSTIDRNMQHNAAMVEESTAASHSLAAEVTELNRLLDNFEVGEMPAREPAKRAAAKQPRLAIAAENPPSQQKQRGKPAIRALKGGGAMPSPAPETGWEEF